ncbi:hypothetical protein BYZ73_09530 [Rhodovulum viride]|uniref:Sulfotransferase family protein n=1 Tax=Rhodovulum viride TaxID=1231134 RepID=A0ABX9DH79_9RHOB|nr:sulfotransferase [Rhodovulum viride]RAP41498.1 hypothetical protein BYZ73_09530 [Rhodovulum viride]
MAVARILFGLGAPKAGTSWLGRYLADHPDCHMRSVKELHFFDALEEGRLERERILLEEKAAGLAGRRPVPRGTRLADLRDLAGVMASGDEAAYLAYLEKGRGARPLVADITPAYGLLPEARLRRMAGLAADVRFVYLLRDPVERLWSHVRMIARRRAAEGEALGPSAGRILARVLKGGEDHIARRGDYRAVLGRVRAAIDPARLWLAFYEELFSDETVDRLCRFLGIAPRPAQLALRVHAGPELPMTDDQRTAAARWLAPQYDYVADRLGRVPAAWQAHRMGV